MLTLFNSLTRSKQTFEPMVAGKVSLYVCGITVYDLCHLGHARSMVCFDVLVRFLHHLGYTVNYIRNITDIDDKIIARARERNVSIDTLTAQYIDAMHANQRDLLMLPPNEEPRATGYLDQMIALIQRLIEAKLAYVSDNGDVCFEVARFEGYGKLSQKDIDGLLAGARVEIVKAKRSPLDFVLWKMAKPDEPAWPSPWGQGRPGWHIECSAMAMDRLGEQFDIHGGGMDLQFPHHENEIAQSEGASGKSYANYWLHVGMLQVNGEKMSKSLGNFYTIDDVLKTHHPEVIRYFLLSNHYRSPLNYTEEHLQSAGKALMRLYQSLRDIESDGDQIDASWLEAFNQAMNDDINTPVALSVLFELSHTLNKSKSPQLASTLKQLGGVLGLLQQNPAIFLQQGLNAQQADTEVISRLITERNQARAERNWARADAIRQTLLEQGIELEDTPNGTIWRCS